MAASNAKNADLYRNVNGVKTLIRPRTTADMVLYNDGTVKEALDIKHEIISDDAPDDSTDLTGLAFGGLYAHVYE